MKKYKFRAECFHDIQALIQAANRNSMDIDYIVEFNGFIPDCVCTISTATNMTEIKNILQAIPNGHVMRETLANEDEYTGVRK